MDDVSIISIANSTTSTLIDEDDITSIQHTKINPNVACSLYANHWVNGKIEKDLCLVKMGYVAGLKEKLTKSSSTVFDKVDSRDNMAKDEIISISSRSSKRSRSPLKSNESGESRQSADCLIKLEDKTQDENQNNLNTERGKFIKQLKSSTSSGRKIILIDDPRVLAHKSKQNATAATTSTGRRVSSSSSNDTPKFEANRLATTSSNHTSTSETIHGPNKLKSDASKDNSKHSPKKSFSHRTGPCLHQDRSSSNQNRSSSHSRVSSSRSHGSLSNRHESSSNRRESSSSNRRESSSSNRRESSSSNRRESSSSNRRESTSSNRRESTSFNRRDSTSSNRRESLSKRSKRSSSSERLSQGKETKKRHSSKDSDHSHSNKKGRLSENKTKSMQFSKTSENLPSSSSKTMNSSPVSPLQEVNIFETERDALKKNLRQSLTKPAASIQNTFESKPSQNFDRRNKSPEVPELDDCVINNMNPKVILNRLKINTLKRDVTGYETETDNNALLEPLVVSMTNNIEAPYVEFQTEEFISDTEDATIEISTNVSLEPIAVSTTSKDVELQTEVFTNDSGTEDVTEEVAANVYVELIVVSMSPNSAPQDCEFQAEEFTSDSGIDDVSANVVPIAVSMTQNSVSIQTEEFTSDSGTGEEIATNISVEPISTTQNDVESQTEVFTSDFSAQTVDGTLEVPNQSILMLQEKVEEYKTILEEREQEIATCRRKIVEQQNIINERQKVIDERNRWVDERDLKIRESNQKVVDYENKIIKQKHKVFESITALEKIRKVNVNLVQLLAKKEKICFENHRDKPKSKKQKSLPLSTSNNELTMEQNLPATSSPNERNNEVITANSERNGTHGPTAFTNSTTQINSPSIQTSAGISAAQRMNHTPPATPPATQSNGRNITPQQSFSLQPQRTMSMGGTTNTPIPLNPQLGPNAQSSTIRANTYFPPTVAKSDHHVTQVENHLHHMQTVERNVMRTFQQAALNPAVDLQPLVNQLSVNQPSVNQPSANQPSVNQPSINQPFNQPVIIQPPTNPLSMNQHFINQSSFSQSLINQQMIFYCLGCHRTAINMSICKTCRNCSACSECYNYIVARHKSECKLPNMVSISNL